MTDSDVDKIVHILCKNDLSISQLKGVARSLISRFYVDRKVMERFLDKRKPLYVRELRSAYKVNRVKWNLSR